MKLPVVGYEGLYEITDDGKVFAMDKIVSRTLRNGMEEYIFRPGKELTWKKRDEYPAIELYKNKVPKFHSIHTLVAKAFISNPNNYPCINHIDEDKNNPRASNLEWCTHQYNQVYSKSYLQYLCDPTGKVHIVLNMNQFIRDNNLTTCGVWRLKTGLQKQHKGWTIYAPTP